MRTEHFVDLSGGVWPASGKLCALSVTKRSAIGSLTLFRPGKYYAPFEEDELCVLFQQIGLLPRLHTLVINFDNLKLPLRPLSRMIREATQLSVLSLTNLCLSGDLLDLQELECALQNKPTLQAIRLVHCQVQDIETKPFSSSPSKTTNCDATDHQIANIFCRCRSLEKLWLQDCPDEDIIAAIQAMKQNKTCLKELSIVSYSVGDKVVGSISQMLKTYTTLEDLKITLFQGQALRIAEAIHSNSSLQKLSCNVLFPCQTRRF